MSLAVLVPVLGRPNRVEPTLQDFTSTVPGCRVLFIADGGDVDELNALRAADADFIAPGGNYASKIREGVEATDEDLIFTAADDLEPWPGWLEAAEAAMRDGVELVGVNDLIERRREHATHFLMTRAYAERPCIDGSHGPFYQGYSHWNCDDELIATAKQRGVYAYATDAHVRHLHPMADRAEDDDTYRKGRARMHQDRKLFKRRQRLWA